MPAEFSRLSLSVLSNPPETVESLVWIKYILLVIKSWKNLNIQISQWRRSGIFLVNFEYISHLVLVFLLLT